jgi:hypothetical protein
MSKVVIDTDKVKKVSIYLVIIVAVAIIALITSIIISIPILKHIKAKSESKFSILLKGLNVGMPYSEVERLLGKPGRTLTNQNDVEEWGTVKDSFITSECNLHMFGRHDVIPHRYILIYEDKKDHIVRLVATLGM